VKRSLLRATLLVGTLISAGAFTAIDDAAATEIAIEIDDARIELVAPKGYCPLEKSDWPLSQLIDFTSDGIKNQGERLAYLVDCERARSWHDGGSGKDVGDIVDYQASPQLRDQNVTSAMLEKLCDSLRKHDDSSKGWFELAVKAIKGAVMGRYGGDTTLTFLVLGFEDDACHVLTFSMHNREKVYTVSALTAIKSKLLTIHVSTKVRDLDLIKGKAEELIMRLMEGARDAATTLVAANQ
jgi:hypothetical protein